MVRYVLVLFGFVFLIWTAATSLTQVQPHERAVIRRFGRILEQKPQQGLYIGWPWGIDRVDLVPIGRVQTITVGFAGKEDSDDEVIPAGQMLTGDHNLVNVQATINYRVRDVDMENYVLQKDQIEAFVARAAEALLAEWVAGHKVDDVLRQGKIHLPLFLIAHLPERLREYALGIEIENANIARLDPPEQVKRDFDRLAQAQTGITTKVNQALQEANNKKDAAKSEVFKLERMAQSYVREERIRAQADADSFRNRLTQFNELSRKNPDYLNALWLDEMTRLYTRMRENGRIELLDHFLTSDGLNITQFPLPRKK